MGSKNLRLAELASNVDISGTYTLSSGIAVYNTVSELPLIGNEAGDMAFVDSGNKLYIYSGEGWYNIALVNQTPTITSGGNGSYSLALDGTPTVITLLATDPEGIPITWSYAVTSGTLGNTATVSQADNVFTITPSTNENDVGEFSITFTASDGVNIATDVNSFTLAFEVIVDYKDAGDVVTTQGTGWSNATRNENGLVGGGFTSSFDSATGTWTLTSIGSTRFNGMHIIGDTMQVGDEFLAVVWVYDMPVDFSLRSYGYVGLYDSSLTRLEGLGFGSNDTDSNGLTRTNLSIAPTVGPVGGTRTNFYLAVRIKNGASAYWYKQDDFSNGDWLYAGGNATATAGWVYFGGLVQKREISTSGQPKMRLLNARDYKNLLVMP